MSSWITNGLKTLRIRVGGTLGSVSQQRGYGAQVKEVEVPPKPKKPLSPYFRYLGQVRSEFQRQHPSLKPTELVKVIAQRWGGLDEAAKQSYITAYKSDIESYSSIIADYNKSLTPEQKEAQQQLKLDKHLQKERRDKKKRLRELGKPKKPTSPFFMYLSNNVPQGSSITEYQAGAKKFGLAWKSMSDAEKAPYVNKYQETHGSYVKALEKWEDKMLNQGHDDLVRENRKNTIARSRAK